MKKNPFILVGLSEFLSKGLSWLSLAIIPFFAPPERYGEIVLFYSLIIFFMPIYLFGQDRLILKNNPEEEVVNSVVFSGLIGLILSFLLYYLGYFLASLGGLMLAFNKIYLTYFRANEKLKKYASNRVLYSVIRFLFVFFTVYYFYSLNNYILSEILAVFLVTFGLFLICLRAKFKISFNFIERFKHGLPLMLHGVSLFGIALVDRFILEKYTNYNIVGNYSFIYIFASGLIFLYSIVSVINEKKIYQSFDQKKLLLNIRNTLFFMLGLGGGGAILSLLLYLFLFKFKLIANYDFMILELLMLLLAHLILPIYLVSNYFLVQQGRSYLLLICSFFAFLINIILNFILVPKFGLKGAVYSTLFSNIILCIVIFFISYRVFQTYRRGIL